MKGQLSVKQGQTNVNQGIGYFAHLQYFTVNKHDMHGSRMLYRFTSKIINTRT